MATSNAELQKQIAQLSETIRKLNDKEISKSAKSASLAAVQFLKENASDIHSIDMDTGYGTVTFKLKRA